MGNVAGWMRLRNIGKDESSSTGLQEYGTVHKLYRKQTVRALANFLYC
ncbi:MAG TPA: hypothetical protein VHC47_01625 [Mucilaginibacter sp.]|nr:hypothetical protein [Mucilaginibacter sp.]